MNRLLLLLVFLLCAQLVEAQTVAPEKPQITYIEDSLHDHFLKMYHASKLQPIPTRIAGSLEEFYTENKVDARLQAKLNAELKMCFNELFSEKDRLWVINRLLIDFAESKDFPLFLIQKEKELILSQVAND